MHGPCDGKGAFVATHNEKCGARDPGPKEYRWLAEDRSLVITCSRIRIRESDAECRSARAGVLRARPDRRTPGPAVSVGPVANGGVLFTAQDATATDSTDSADSTDPVSYSTGTLTALAHHSVVSP